MPMQHRVRISAYTNGCKIDFLDGRGGSYLEYSSDPAALSNGDGVLELWAIEGSNAQISLILLKWAPAH
jgi:hypothetical protein